METQFDIAVDDDALIEQHLGAAYRGRRFLRYAEIEALGLVDNRGSLENWMEAGAFPRAIKIPGKYGKVMVWFAVEVARLIDRRLRERDASSLCSESETSAPEERSSVDSNSNNPLRAGCTNRGRHGQYAPP